MEITIELINLMFAQVNQETYCLCCMLIVSIQVVDFSLAQHEGFCQAYVKFYKLQQTALRDLWSDAKICKDATTLVKGCLQHYCSGVTHVSKISRVLLYIPMTRRNSRSSPQPWLHMTPKRK
jgi:hypothetical protein